MQKFIGIDVHSASSTVAVIGPSGKRLKNLVVSTSAAELLEVIKGIAGEKHVCIEEGLQAEWLYEVISPYVVEVVVTNLSNTRRSTKKSDEVDAFARADELRLGLIEKRVYKQRGSVGALRSIVHLYNKVVADHVRMQNRVKALFRARGISLESYCEDQQKTLIALLPGVQRMAAQLTFSQFNALTQTRTDVEAALKSEAKKHATVKLLCSLPGFATKRAAQVLAVIVDPHRFKSKRHFWSYCGFAINTEVSGEWQQSGQTWKRIKKPMTRGLTRSFNRSLKNVFNGAAETVIMTANADEPLYQYYVRQLTAGTNPDSARLSLARKIAAISLAMMKEKEVYKPQKYSNNNINEAE